MKTLWELYIIFCRISGFTFGGGYSMLPMLEKELVENKKWCTGEEILDFYAVSQCLPGIIAINTANFVGFRIKGARGAVAAVLGVVTPCLVIIMVIAAFIQNFSDLPAVQHAFAGIRVAVGILILSTLIKLCKSGVKDVIGVVIFIAAFFTLVLSGISPVFIVIAAAAAGIAVGRMRSASR